MLENGKRAMSLGNQPDDNQGGPAPFDGYDRLKPRDVKKGMANHSQDELAEMERYERANQGRASILDKLRYMRGRQPVEGYDQLSPEEIVKMLGDADVETIKKVRSYERKFANRPDVLEEVTRVHHLRRGTA